MTPEREKYFARCSEREKILRMLIKSQNREIKKYKEILNNGYFDNEEESYCYYKISIFKVAVQGLRHELARLKGMDRVVVPKVSYIGVGDDVFLQRVERCSCGERLMCERYCPECGCRILWEKVK